MKGSSQSHAILRQAGYGVMTVVGLLVGHLVLAVLASLLIPDPILATLVYSIVVFSAVLALRYRRPEWITYTPTPPRGSLRASFWLWVLLALVVAFVLGQAASMLAYEIFGSKGFEGHNDAKASSTVVLVLLLTLFVAPIAEETLLRGLLFPVLRRKINLVVSTALTTAIFMLLHGNIVQAVVVLPLGVLLAVVYERSQRLLPVILLHWGFNLAALVVPASVISIAASPLGVALAAILFVMSIASLPRGATVAA